MFLRSKRLFLRPFWPEEQAPDNTLAITLPGAAVRGELAPIIGMARFERRQGLVALDLAIAPEWQRQGFATEAGRALVDWALFPYGWAQGSNAREPMAIRKRLSPGESRDAALEAARLLLIEAGPQAVTLKAVAARIGRTHANLLHHFGSAAELQADLARHITGAICAKIREVVLANRQGGGSPRDVVDLTFDAFDREGAGALASWMLITGNRNALDPIVETIHDLVVELDEFGGETRRDTTLALTLMALGDALLGGPLSRALELPRTRARDCAEAMLVESMPEDFKRMATAASTPADR